jgi:hypothetical protein
MFRSFCAFAKLTSMLHDFSQHLSSIYNYNIHNAKLLQYLQPLIKERPYGLWKVTQSYEGNYIFFLLKTSRKYAPFFSLRPGNISPVLRSTILGC